MRSFNDFAVAGRWPDLVVYIRLDIAVVRERLKKRTTDRFEQEDDAFFARVTEGFEELARREPGRWLVVDGLPPKDDVQRTIRDGVRERLGI